MTGGPTRERAGSDPVTLSLRQPRPGRRRRRTSVISGLLVAVFLLGLGGMGLWLRGSVGSLPLRPHCVATALGNSTELDPEQTGNAATIAAVGLRRDLPARAATIAIATGMQESKLRNISYGDRDSLGLFQQRPSQGWGTAKEIMDPVYASNAFYDVLVKIEGYQNLAITKAAQKVQRSGFPSAYADHEPQARILASALAGHSPAALECVLRMPEGLAPQTPGAGGLTTRAAGLVAAAERETGRRGAVPAGSGGTAVGFTAAGPDGPRLAWALAQWAVGRAEGLAIVAVEVDGQQWRRDRVDAGWEGPDDGQSLPGPRTVVVRVAG